MLSKGILSSAETNLFNSFGYVTNSNLKSTPLLNVYSSFVTPLTLMLFIAIFDGGIYPTPFLFLLYTMP
jgi:hypothetical protein